MALTDTPDVRATHRDIHAKGQIYATGDLAIDGATELDGAVTMNTTLAVTGVATFTAAPSLPAIIANRTFRGIAAAASIATAGAATYTIANLVTGTIVRDCAGASRTDVLPTAALAVAGLTAAFGVAPAVGDCLDCLIINGSDPVSEILTIDAGTGGTWDANQTAVSRTILGTDRALIRLRFTNVTASSEAYVVYL